MTIEELKKIKADLLKNCSGYSGDFINYHDIVNISYFCDAFTEFADSRTSVYYSEQKGYYLSHSEECDSAILEYYDNDSLAQIVKDEGIEGLLCKAGAVGEYQAIYNELSNDEENIKKALIIRYLIDTELSATMEQLEDIFSTCEDEDDADSIIDYIKQVLGVGE